MARIRTIKPEFFDHDGLYDAGVESGLGPYVRLFFAGLWTQCDKDGRFSWKPRVLKVRILPFDEGVTGDQVLAALEAGDFVRRYEVDGKLYGYIPAWHDHQSIQTKEKSGESKLPDPTPENTLDPANTAEIQGDVTGTTRGRDRDMTGTCLASSGKEGKGKERKGKEGGNTSPLAEEATFSAESPDPPSPSPKPQKHPITRADSGASHHKPESDDVSAIKRGWCTAWREVHGSAYAPLGDQVKRREAEAARDLADAIAAGSYTLPRIISGMRRMLGDAKAKGNSLKLTLSIYRNQAQEWGSGAQAGDRATADPSEFAERARAATKASEAREDLARAESHSIVEAAKGQDVGGYIEQLEAERDERSFRLRSGEAEPDDEIRAKAIGHALPELRRMVQARASPAPLSVDGKAELLATLRSAG